MKWSYYYLFVIIDIYSRYVPGWLIAPRESSQLVTTLTPSPNRVWPEIS